MKLKKGDEIIVTLGKDKGKRGKIDNVLTKEDMVVVPGVNVSKRHMKKRNEQSKSGIIDIAKPLSAGKVALICPKCKQPTRIGYQITKTEKLRICRKCKQVI